MRFGGRSRGCGLQVQSWVRAPDVPASKTVARCGARNGALGNACACFPRPTSSSYLLCLDRKDQDSRAALGFTGYHVWVPPDTFLTWVSAEQPLNVYVVTLPLMLS
ncbi:hypothetical protein CAURIC_06845 [Corynebacterium auriscanis]|nr:hypothetical protein CAURIC_06845 [Corynebacterium auriscanis]